MAQSDGTIRPSETVVATTTPQPAQPSGRWSRVNLLNGPVYICSDCGRYKSEGHKSHCVRLLALEATK